MEFQFPAGIDIAIACATFGRDGCTYCGADVAAEERQGWREDGFEIDSNGIILDTKPAPQIGDVMCENASSHLANPVTSMGNGCRDGDRQ